MKNLLICLCLAVLAAGCASNKPLDMNKVAKLFYEQQRSTKLLELGNVSEFTLRGTNMTIAVSTELQPLSILPRDPSTVQSIAETAGRVAVAGVGIYTAGAVMSKLADQPQVISQQVVSPEIVRPEIVRVPESSTEPTDPVDPVTPTTP